MQVTSRLVLDWKPCFMSLFGTLKNVGVQRRLISALDLHYWFTIDKLWLLNLFNEASMRSSYLPIL